MFREVGGLEMVRMVRGVVAFAFVVVGGKEGFGVGGAEGKGVRLLLKD